MSGPRRPERLKEWENDKDKLILIQHWARLGHVDEKIAQLIGIAPRTLYEWKKKSPQIAQSLKAGKEVVDAMVVSALLKNALSGNVVAQIFWLKNRLSKEWRDNPDDKPTEVTVIFAGENKLED